MTLSDKLDFILPLVRGKRVLDLGCVQHEIANADKEDWLHGRIKREAASLLGVDYLPDEVALLRERGFDVVCADVESMSLGRTFEVVVAGDIIEHLSNPGAMLRSVRAHLEPGGCLVVTTPNPVTFLRFIRAALLGKVGGNEEHTCWFTRRTLRRLAANCGYEVAGIAYVDDVYRWYRQAPKAVFIAALPLLAVSWCLTRIRPQLSETLGFVLIPK